MDKGRSESEILHSLILCGKVDIEDIPFEDRTQMNCMCLYMLRHRITRYMQDDKTRRQNLSLLRLMSDDIAKMEDSQTRRYLINLFEIYLEEGEQYGVVLRDFPKVQAREGGA